MAVVPESVLNGRLTDYINARNGEPLFISAASFDVLSSVIHYFGKQNYWLVDEQEELHDSSRWNVTMNGIAFVITNLMEWNQHVLTVFANGQVDVIIPSVNSDLRLTVHHFAPKALLTLETPAQKAAKYGIEVGDILIFNEVTVNYDVLSSDED